MQDVDNFGWKLGLVINGDGPDALPGDPDRTRVGSTRPDAPLKEGFLISELGNAFKIHTIDVDAPDQLDKGGITVTHLAISTADDPTGALTTRYLGDATGAVYLIRPDQHVATRWDSHDEAALRAAIRTATAKGGV